MNVRAQWLSQTSWCVLYSMRSLNRHISVYFESLCGLPEGYSLCTPAVAKKYQTFFIKIIKIVNFWSKKKRVSQRLNARLGGECKYLLPSANRPSTLSIFQCMFAPATKKLEFLKIDFSSIALGRCSGVWEIKKMNHQNLSVQKSYNLYLDVMLIRMC